MHTAEAGAYCLGVFDNSGSGTLLGGITFRNILVCSPLPAAQISPSLTGCSLLPWALKLCTGLLEGL